jgi:uncharacterized protein (UPF0147 family)
VEGATVRLKKAEQNIVVVMDALVESYSENEDLSIFIGTMQNAANELSEADETITRIADGMPKKIRRFKEAIGAMQNAERDVLIGRANHIAQLQEMYDNPKQYITKETALLE